MADHAHRHHQHDHAPEGCRHQHTPRIDGRVRQQGHDDQRGGRDHQPILQFALADEFAAQALQWLLGLQQQSGQHPQPRGGDRVLMGQRRKQRGHHQGHLAGQAGILVHAAQVGHHRKGPGDHQRSDEHPGAQHPRHMAQQGAQSVCADAGLRDIGSAMPALAHHADHQAQAQGRQQAGEIGVPVHRALPCSCRLQGIVALAAPAVTARPCAAPADTAARGGAGRRRSTDRPS